MDFVAFTFFGILLFLSWSPLLLQACTTSEIECPLTHTCIPRSIVCDYYYDCSDNVDEDDTDTCPFPSADMSIAVIYSVNGGYSHLINMSGDPDQYGPMFGKPSLANSLPLRYTGQLGNPTNTFGPITVDYLSRIVYYVNITQGLIKYGHLVYNSVTGLNDYPSLPVTRPISSLAFDWAAKNLYWIDGEIKFIAALSTKWTTRPPWKVLVTNLNYPKDVAICPPSSSLCDTCGGLFWTDGSGPSAKIERSDLSGNNRVVLVNSTQGLVAPTILVVDFTSERLYWLDAAANILGAINLHDFSVKTWYQTAFSVFTTMTTRGNIIFFGNNTRSGVHIYNKTSVTAFGAKEFSRATGLITDMATFSADSQPPSQNPCNVDNGNCSQLCFVTSSTTRICGCANGLVLSADGLSCEINPFNTSNNPKLLFLSDFNQWSIYQLHPDTGEIRVVALKSYPIALTVDTTLNILYFIFKDDSANNTYRLHRRSFDGKIDESFFNASNAISRLVGLALDSTRGLLYYTDSYNGIVGELSTNGSQSRIIFQVFEEFPRAIVVDSRNSRLYWTDCSPPPSVTSIQTSRVDGTDRRTVVSGIMGSCYTGLAVDFIKQVMYFSNSTTVETSTVNGSLRTAIYNKAGADFSAITIMNDSLVIADRNQRIPVKYNLITSRMSGTMQLPPSSVIFSNVSDIKFFDFNPGVKYYCRIVISNLIFKPQYSNQSTTEYQTLFNRINPLLVSVYTRTLGAIFLYIDDIRFNNGTVIVYNDIQLTSLPSDQLISTTMAAILHDLTEASLLVSDANDVNMSSVPFRTNLYGRITIANMTFAPQLSNETTTEHQTLSNRTRALLTPIFARTLGTTFVGIVGIRFSPGSVIAFVDIQVTREPNDQTINATKMAIINGMAADSLLVTDVSMSSYPFGNSTVTQTQTTTMQATTTPAASDSSLTGITPHMPGTYPAGSSPQPTAASGSTTTSMEATTTSSTSTTTTTTPKPGGLDQTIIIIIGVVVGVGGFVIVVVVLIVCFVFFLIQKKKEKGERIMADNSASGSDPGIYQDIGYSEIGMVLFDESPSSTFVDGAAAAGYEPLRKKPGDTLKLPFAPEPPSSRKTLADCNPYLLSNDVPLTGSRTSLNQGAPDYLQVNSLARPQNHYIDKDAGAVNGEVQTGRPQNNYVVNNREDSANYIHITPSNPYAQIESSPSCQPRRIISANVRESILPEPDDRLDIASSHPYAQIESSKQQASRASSANSMDADKEDYLNIVGSNPYAQIESPPPGLPVPIVSANIREPKAEPDERLEIVSSHAGVQVESSKKQQAGRAPSERVVYASIANSK